METGKGLDKLREMIKAQGGNSDVCNDIKVLPQAKIKLDVLAEQDGFIGSMDTIRLGYAVQSLGAGRQKKDDVIDYAVGYVLHKRVGDLVKKGESIASIFADDMDKAENTRKEILASIPVVSKQPEKTKLIYAIVDENGTKYL